MVKRFQQPGNFHFFDIIFNEKSLQEMEQNGEGTAPTV